MEQLVQFLPLLVLFGLMYAVVFLPQRRQRQKHRDLMASLAEGDEVLLSSGIHGFVGAIDDDVVWVEVASGVELKVAKSSIAGRVEVAEDEDSES